ncbi:MAG: cadmium-translocating P-type ATPase [Clostridia bacterium]|nr:cadmium-translocating P-type ATPase [Clostridia bacterium]
MHNHKEEKKHEYDHVNKYKTNEKYEHTNTCACEHHDDGHHKHGGCEESNCCGHSHEHSTSKFDLIKIIISAVLFVCAITLNINEKLKLVFLLISYIVIGYDIILNAFKSLFKGHPFDENFLMTLATIGAWGIGEVNEAVAVMLFYKVGEYFQSKAVSSSRKSIADLMDIRPDSANLKVGDDIKTVSPEEVEIGDIIVVKAGEKIPLDGIIMEGNSFVDTVALTGESVPREVEEADEVLAGMINTKALLTIQVTKKFNDTTVSKVLDLVENTASQKAKTEKFITKFAKVYTPIVVILALIMAIIPPLVIPNATFSEWIYKALVCLVISCPCALVLSIPLSYFAGIGCASKKGVLIKGSNYLEALNDLDTLILDKTGTLTEGVFKVAEIVQVGKYSKEEMIKYCAYAEAFSNHPIATSILDEYNAEIEEEQIKDYEEISGHGIKANVYGKEVLAGNKKLLDKESIHYAKTGAVGTVVYLAIDKEYCGYILISDKIKEDSKVALKKLKKMGLRKIVMLTGDNKVVAENVAKELNLDDYKAELLPHQKVGEVEKLLKEKKANKTLGFVGDGINDAPVLARADIGIAMGGIGSDAAIEASDVVIMNDEISKISTAIKIAKKTKKIVLQNITFAMIIKIAAIILGLLNIAAVWHAVIADVGVTIIAVLNSLRCLKIKE